MNIMIFSIYILIGIIVACIDWNRSLKKEWDKVKDMHISQNDSILVMYLMTITIFWPLKIISDLVHKD